MEELKPQPASAENIDSKKSEKPIKKFRIGSPLKRVLIILLAAVLFSGAYIYASVYKELYTNKTVTQNQPAKDLGSDTSGISQEPSYGNTTQEDPRLIITKDQYEYYPSQLIPFTSAEEPAIYLANSNFDSKIMVKLYRATADDILNSLVYDPKEQKSESKFDESKLSLVKELEVTPEKNSQGSTKVILPLDESGVYFIRASADTANKVSDGAFIVRSTFAVVSKEGNNEIMYWGTNLKVNQSIDDGQVKVFNLADKVTQVGSGNFNSDGIATTLLSSKNDVAVVYRGSEISIIPLNLQYIDFGYNYDTFNEKKVDTAYFTFVDRPLYKPGDTINYKSIIRSDDDARYTIPSGTAEVKIWKGYEDSDVVYDSKQNITSDGSVFGSYKLSDDAPTGSYRISIEYPADQVHDPDEYYYPTSEYFEVEFFRKPEYNIDLTVDDKEYISGDRLNFKILGNYFSGQPITEGKVKYTILSSDFYDYGYYSEYQQERLNDDYRYGYWYGDTLKSGELDFDSNGVATFDDIVMLKDTYKTNQVISIEAEYDNGSGNPSFASKNVLFYKGESSVYLQENAPYGGVINKDFEVPMVMVSHRDSSVSNVVVDATLNWTTYEKTYIEGQKYPEYKQVTGSADPIELKTDNVGHLTYKFKPTLAASYVLTINYTDSLGNKISRDFNFYISDKEYSYYGWESNSAQQGLKVIVDKKLYNPEDTAKVTISSDDMTTRDFLITLERGRVQRYLTTKMENGLASIDIPLKDTDSPNVFVVATTFDEQGLSVSSENIVISKDTKKINLQITPRGTARYGPGEDVTVDVSTTDNLNQPVSTDMALWTVDKALFELVDQNNYDILDNFWSDRYNDTSSTHSLMGISASSAESGGGCFIEGTKVLTKNGWVPIETIKIGDNVLTKKSELDSELIEAKVTAIHHTDTDGYLIINQNLKVTSNHVMWVNNSWATAGTIQKGDLLLDDKGNYINVNSVEISNTKADVYNLEVENYHTYFAGGFWVHNQKGGDARTTFKDTAYWNPSLHTDSAGKATVTFKLPDNLTTWVIAGIAANTKTQVGVAKKEIIVGKDIVVRPTLPNILRENDKGVFAALVQNYTDNSEDFDVSLKFDSGSVEPAANQTVKIDSNKSVTVYWTITPTKINEASKLTYSAVSKTTPANSDTIVQSIPVKQFGFSEERGESKRGDAEYDVKLAADSTNDKSSIKLNISSDILGSLRPSMDYLIDYPYGCMEQTTSRFVPAIVAKENPKIFAAALVDKDIDAILKDGIKRIEDHQQGDGGWTWVYTGPSNTYLTSYIVEYLVKAKNLGYEVDQATLERAKTYFEPLRISQDRSERVYAAYGLEMMDQNDINVMDFENISVEANAMAVMINMRNGLTNPDANGLTRLISLAKRESGIAYWDSKDPKTFGTKQSATALAIRAILASNSNKDILGEAMQYISQDRGGYYWGNTHGTAQVMSAISEYSKANKVSETNYTYSVTLDDKVLSSGKFTDFGQAPREINIPTSTVSQNGSKLKITKVGTGDLLTSTIIKEFHTDPNTKALAHGLEVKRTYVSEKGLGKSIAVGDLVNVYVQVKNNFEPDSSYGVIQDELPSGLVPVNTTFNNEQFSGNNNNSYYSGVDYTQNGAVSYIYSYRDAYSYVNYQARAISEGTYQIPPVTASLMYTPEIYGRSGADKITITRDSKNFDKSSTEAIANQEIAGEHNKFMDDYGLYRSPAKPVSNDINKGIFGIPEWILIIIYVMIPTIIIIAILRLIKSRINRKNKKDLEASPKNESKI